MSHAKQPSVLRSLTIPALAAGGLALVYYVAILTTFGQTLDTAIMLNAYGLSGRLTNASAWMLAQYAPVPYVLAGVAILGVGWWRRGTSRMLAAATAIISIDAVAEVLKHSLSRPALSALSSNSALLSANSFPSGHTAGIAALGAALVIVTKPAFRAVSWMVAALSTAAVGVALVVTQWHRPSDVIASVLLAIGFGSLADTVAARAEQRATVPATGLRWVS